MNKKISEFIAAINNKEYSTANDRLRDIVMEKHKERVKQEIIKYKTNK